MSVFGEHSLTIRIITDCFLLNDSIAHILSEETLVPQAEASLNSEVCLKHLSVFLSVLSIVSDGSGHKSPRKL